jgi:hypothetical protein
LIPHDSLAGFLARSEASDDLKAFFAARGITPAAEPAPTGDDPLLELTDPAEVDAATSDDRKGKLVSVLPIMERLKLAMRGSREQRAILIRDPHKLVALAVLSSPKVTGSEIESFARQGNVSEEVLRVIGQTRAWMKNYAVMSALARNPKCPPAISLRLVSHLNQRDIRMLSIDRNVPESLRLAARKFLTASESRRQ